MSGIRLAILAARASLPPTGIAIVAAVALALPREVFYRHELLFPWSLLFFLQFVVYAAVPFAVVQLVTPKLPGAATGWSRATVERCIVTGAAVPARPASPSPH